MTVCINDKGDLPMFTPIIIQEGSDYRINSCIGRGRTGIVYLIEKKKKKNYVLKEINLGQLFSKEEEIRRYIHDFRNMVNTLSKIKVPNISHILDIHIEDKIIEIVSEYVDGMTLSSYVQMSGTLPVDEVVTISKPLVDTINVLHMNHIVANDIKPDNIIINKEGNAIFIDADSFAEENSINRSISRWYSAPEKTKDDFRVKKEVDYYSIGACMYYSLTGKYPPSSFDILYEPDKDNFIELNGMKDVPNRLKQIIIQLMDKDINQRISDCNYINNELTGILEEYCRNEKQVKNTGSYILYMFLMAIVAITQVLIYLCIKVI